MTSNNQIASGFEFEPLPDGNVLIRFSDDDGATISTQTVTGEALAHIPLVALVAEKLAGLMNEADDAA